MYVSGAARGGGYLESIKRPVFKKSIYSTDVAAFKLFFLIGGNAGNMKKVAIHADALSKK
jgi:hypothetical protein